MRNCVKITKARHQTLCREEDFSMKIARYLRLLIAMLLCLAFVPASAETMHVATSNVDIEEFFGVTSEELFELYVDNTLYDREMAFFSDAAYSSLSERQQKLYVILEEELSRIANGKLASTSITVDAVELRACGYISVESIRTQEEYNEAVASFEEAVMSDFDALNLALALDHPFDMYWYGNQTDLRLAYDLLNNSIIDFQARFIFQVNKNYQPSGYDINNPTIDTSKTGATSFAGNKANEIVAKYAQKEDHEKIYGYIAEICALTDYNDDAAADMGSASTDNSPWQLLWVFDGVETTNVVCEGYAKAFQYLCDLTTFKSDKVVSYLVTGNMTGGTGAGPHMWNVVTMDDGKNYIVDVTNSEEGTVGQDGQFMLGGTENRLPAHDPTPDKNDTWGETYQFVCNPKQTMYFTYDANLPYTADQLKLASAPYNYTNVAYVADVNGTKYEVFSHALNAWMGSGTTTLTLLKDIELTEVVKLDTYYGDKVLDLNGHTYTITAGTQYCSTYFFTLSSIPVKLIVCN